MTDNKAIVLTNGLFYINDAKTAHGLVRGTERFTIAGIVDSPENAGRDAGELLDGKRRNIPVFGSLESAIQSVPDARYLIIGIATVGGVLPPDMHEMVRTGIRSGLSVVNGLHEYLSENTELAALAREHGVELIDVRKPRNRADLHFWTGEIWRFSAPVIAVMGTDCALGKRTTARLIRECCELAGLNARMIYTGQTGWLQGGEYGFIFDSTLNDFVSGELEHAIVTCWKETQADFILLEGQASLRNPSGPCGSEFLVSGNAKSVVLVHAPARVYYDNDAHWGRIPDVGTEINLIACYGSKVIALALNTEGCTPDEAVRYRDEYEARFNIPVLLPLEEGVDKILPVLKSLKP